MQKGRAETYVRHPGEHLLAALGVADRQILSAFGPSARQHATTILGGHARAESVLVGAFATAGLIRTFHGPKRYLSWHGSEGCPNPEWVGRCLCAAGAGTNNA